MTGENAHTPYDYSQRKGVLPVSWNDFHGICKALARAVFAYRPELVLPVGRGGYYPGTLIAHMLQADVFPVRLSRRVNDLVVYTDPRWLLEPPADVRGRRVLVVDEISSSGQTLQFVKEKTLALGAQEVRCAVMYAHTWGTQIPEYIGLVSDELILNPWDREVLDETGFHIHPEYAQALALQGLESGPELLIPATDFVLAKGA